MEIISTALIFVLTILLVKLFSQKFYNVQDDKQPPCLPHIPIFGSMPFLAKFEVLHLFLTAKAKQLGEVIGLYLAGRYVVVLSGRDAIHEGLVKNAAEFAQRPHFYLHRYFNQHKHGIVEHPYNEHFKKFHYLSLSILRKFGFGQGVMELRIKREVEEMINQFDQKNGAPFDPADILTLCVSNITLTIIFGKRMQLGDPKFTELVQIVHDMLRDVKDPTNINFFPIIRFLPKYKKAIATTLAREEKMRICMEEKIQESIAGKTEDCFISHFIEEMGPDYENEKEQLLYTLRDLFLAGTETTSNTLLWLIVLLANHQNVQEKAQKELDSVVGRDHLPTLENKNKLKYLEAVIMESMRWKTIVPLALLHVTSHDTLIRGKKIPAGTWVFPNLYSAHMDETVWNQPHLFDPERFIDKDGEIINRNQIIPFSLGKRSCFGETLARQEIFLFTSALLHQYKILPPDGLDNISTEEYVGVTISPKNFEFKLIKR